jgi:hypothetical protein
MSIGLPFTRIPLDAGKLEFQERWSRLEVAAVGHSLRNSLLDDRRRHLGVGAGPADGFGSCLQAMLGDETAHPALTALCQKLRLSQFLWDDFCGNNKVHQVTKVQRVLI